MPTRAAPPAVPSPHRYLGSAALRLVRLGGLALLTSVLRCAPAPPAHQAAASPERLAQTQRPDAPLTSSAAVQLPVEPDADAATRATSRRALREEPPSLSPELLAALHTGLASKPESESKPPSGIRTETVEHRYTRRLPTGARAAEKRVTTVEIDWSRYTLALDVPDAQHTRAASVGELFLSLSYFVPAGALAIKAKSFDDGLYAAVELAVSGGVGTIDPRGLLADIVRALPSEPTPGAQDAQALLAAATELDGVVVDVSEQVHAEAVEIARQFFAAPERSMPLGFYGWSPELARAFRRDRLLQTSLSNPSAAAIANVLRAEPQLGARYASWLALASQLTNPFVAPDVRAGAQGGAAFLPASRSHERDLARPYQRQPPGTHFNLADELVRQVAAGAVSLRPRANSGWYDFVSWALEPLVHPDGLPEARRLVLRQAYRDQRARLFKGLLALARETHVKQLSSWGMGGASEQPPKVRILPQLSVEPLPTHYLRRAESYRFVRQLLERSFGATSLHGMRRQSAAGPSRVPLDEELAFFEGLFYGAYLTSCDELLLPSTNLTGSPWSDRCAAARQLFTSWKAGASQDPDLRRDVRMMVPLERGDDGYRVWAVVGVMDSTLAVNFVRPPVVTSLRDSYGVRVDPSTVLVEVLGASYNSLELSAFEATVPVLLDRSAFQKLCDQYPDTDELLAAWRALPPEQTGGAARHARD